MRILVIDDEEVIRATVCEILAAEGHVVTTAGNGVEGLKRIEGSSFDLVISDLFMPEKDGVEVILEVKRKYPDMKIISMSGGGSFGDKASLKTATLLGATYTIEKPFTAGELLELVAKTFSN